MVVPLNGGEPHGIVMTTKRIVPRIDQMEDMHAYPKWEAVNMLAAMTNRDDRSYGDKTLRHRFP
jgi:hypothetical protein